MVSDILSTSETKSLKALLSKRTLPRSLAARIIMSPALRAALKAVLRKGFMGILAVSGFAGRGGFV
jgi:hypothetical protein